MLENSCPSADQLSEYVLGKLDEGRIVAIADHLENCENCRSRAASVELHTDCLIEQLRCEVKSDPYCKEPALEKALSGMLDGNGRSPGRTRFQRFALPAQFHKYRILEEIGAGAMGTVYRAEDVQLERQIALKIPHFGPTENPELIARFVRESKAAARLDHPNICHVHDAGEIDGIYFIAMQLVEGQSLTTAIESHAIGTHEQSVRLVRMLALAMDDAHKMGVVHRDLKPDNILMNQSGTPVITDFGLASRTEELMEEARLSRSGMPIGSPAYMSPEQVNGQIHLFGPTCDIYALGVILFELLTGERPFQGTVASVLAQISRDPSPHVSDRRADIPQQLDEICFRAMAKNPDDRFATMSDLAERLDEFLQSAIVVPGSVGTNGLQSLNLDKSNQVQIAGSPSRSFKEFVREYKWVLVILFLLALAGVISALPGPDPAPRPNIVQVVPAKECVVRFVFRRSGATSIELAGKAYNLAEATAGIALPLGRYEYKVKKGDKNIGTGDIIVESSSGRTIIVE